MIMNELNWVLIFVLTFIPFFIIVVLLFSLLHIIPYCATQVPALLQFCLGFFLYKQQRALISSEVLFSSSRSKSNSHIYHKSIQCMYVIGFCKLWWIHSHSHIILTLVKCPVPFSRMISGTIDWIRRNN